MTTAELLGQWIGWIRERVSRIWLAEARMKGVECHPSVVFLGRPLISRLQGSRMVFSEGVRIHSSRRANPLGCFQPCVLRTLGPNAELIVGKNAGMSGTIIVAGNSVTIGEGTIFGSGAMVVDNDFHAPEGEWGWRGEHVEGARPVKIGRGVFIGARAMVLKGVTIGDHAVVGAGAVVTRDVPEGMIAAGNPATIIGPTRWKKEGVE